MFGTKLDPTSAAPATNTRKPKPKMKIFNIFKRNKNESENVAKKKTMCHWVSYRSDIFEDRYDYTTSCAKSFKDKSKVRSDKKFTCESCGDEIEISYF